MTVYPSSLPLPSIATIKANERRLLTPIVGPRAARAIQRDRLEMQRLEWVFSMDEAATFEAWVKTALIEGGAWFAASWPHPTGATAVRRFVQRPTYPQYLLGAGWKVSATCVVRGVGEPPIDALASVGYLLHFDDPTNPQVFPDAMGNTWAREASLNAPDLAVSATNPKFGAGSLRVATTNPSTANFTIATTSVARGPFLLPTGNPFTMSGWLWWTGHVDSRVAVGGVLAQLGEGAPFVMAEIRMYTTNQFTFNTKLNGADDDRVVSPPLSSWVHLEMGFDGSRKYWFVNGVLQGSAAIAADPPLTVVGYRIRGISAGSDGAPAAWIDECRFDLGVCLHVADFTPPTAPY